MVLTAIALTVAAIGCAEAARIRISYSFVYDRIRPEPQKNVAVTNRLEIELSESGSVQENLTRSAGNVTDGFKTGARLGDGQWSVVSNNQLRRTFDQPQSTLELTVTTKDNTCTLDVKWTLKPNFTEYQFRRITDGTLAFFTEPKMQGTTCAIQ